MVQILYATIRSFLIRYKLNDEIAVTEALRKSFNRKKDKNKIATKQSAKPFEIVETLGITSEGVFPSEKSSSLWKNLAKHWSLTPTPQSEAPVQIKSRNNLQPKVLTRKNKKRTLKANPAMSRLTRLASTKINISNLDLFSEGEDQLANPSEHVSQNYLLEMPSSLPFDLDSKEEYWLHLGKNNVNSSINSQPSEYSNVMVSSNRDRPFINHRENNQSSVSHLGYSSSKPNTSNFIMPTQALQPSLEENLCPTRLSTIDHYSRLTGGPFYHGKTMKATKYSPDDRMESNIKQSRGSSFYDDDYDIEYNNDNDVLKNKRWNEDNDDERNTKKSIYTESRFQNLNQYQNEELDAYNSFSMKYLKTDLKRKQKPPKFPSSSNEDLDHSQDFNSIAKKEVQTINDSYEQTNQFTSMASMSNENQPMYRRVSASGHVSLILQPDTMDLPPHESPFADYTKHGLNKENPKANMSGDLMNGSFRVNNENRLLSKEIKLDDKKPPKILSTKILESFEPLRIEPMIELEKTKLQQNSLEHASKEVEHSIIQTHPCKSSFVDYSKHGIREQPTSKDSNEDSSNQFASAYFNKDEKLLNPNNMQIPSVPTISNYVVQGRSPWTSETNDPSHLITPTLGVPLLPTLDQTIAIVQPNVNIDIPNIVDSTVTTNSTQRSSATSRVSLYSSIDVPTYKQALEVIPHRSSRSEPNF